MNKMGGVVQSGELQGNERGDWVFVKTTWPSEVFPSPPLVFFYCYIFNNCEACSM